MSEPSLWETVAKAGINHGLQKETELQQRITDLEEALRPFAELTYFDRERLSSDEVLSVHLFNTYPWRNVQFGRGFDDSRKYRGSLTVGHLRRARVLLVKP